MKKFKLILIAILGLLGTSAMAQNSLSEAVAAGNKVYFKLINDDQHPIPADEIEDVTRELIAAGEWTAVASPEEADFILQVEAKKKMVFNSPRTWLTPTVLDKSGEVLWKSKTQQADATMFNGFRATDTCIKKVIEKSFQADLFKKAGRK
ncbi:MAG: hypothetical protein IJP81_01785 [Bacteroidales bacterium]|nr:hypothetical protein [Bacteroidales bacterium]